jgi:hypothetical protein
MATSKSTVVGIRLDHDRRAWVEAEAARRGVSVRGLFEGMIDGARSGENADAARAIAGLGSAAPSAVGGERQDEAAVSRSNDVSTPEQPGTVDTPPPAPLGGAPGSSPWSNLGSVTAIPCGLIRGAFSVTAGLIESTGRCATKKLGGCVLTRVWGEHSV